MKPTKEQLDEWTMLLTRTPVPPRQATLTRGDLIDLIQAARERAELVAFLKEHGDVLREGLVNADDIPDSPGNPGDTPWGKRLAAFDALLERFAK